MEWSGGDHLWNAGVCSVESRSQSGEHTLHLVPDNETRYLGVNKGDRHLSLELE